nr:enoyl-CoA hydratase-related protein [Ornithinimicrobium cryptoxanthini]
MRDGVATLWLNRPSARNAMNSQLHEAMEGQLDRARKDPAARVVVIRGAGGTFCAGMDLGDTFVPDADPAEALDRAQLAANWRLNVLPSFPKPTIAAVEGYCFGGAFSIVQGCDLAFAAENARFGLSEINFMMFPGGPVSRSLGLSMTSKVALYYAMTGEQFNGKSAQEIGFINEAVPDERLDERIREVAASLTEKDPHALRATKEAYRFSLEMGPEAAINYAIAKQAELSVRQNDEWRTGGVKDFLDGVYRPGFGARGSKIQE